MGNRHRGPGWSVQPKGLEHWLRSIVIGCTRACVTIESHTANLLRLHHNHHNHFLLRYDFWGMLVYSALLARKWIHAYVLVSEVFFCCISHIFNVKVDSLSVLDHGVLAGGIVVCSQQRASRCLPMKWKSEFSSSTCIWQFYFFVPPCFLAGTCSVSARLRSTRNWFYWETPSGDVSVSGSLVRQRMQFIRQSQRVCEDNTVFNAKLDPDPDIHTLESWTFYWHPVYGGFWGRWICSTCRWTSDLLSPRSWRVSLWGLHTGARPWEVMSTGTRSHN